MSNKSLEGSFENPIKVKNFEDFEGVEFRNFVNIKGNPELFVGRDNLYGEGAHLEGEMKFTLFSPKEGLILLKTYNCLGNLDAGTIEVINRSRESRKYEAYSNLIEEAKKQNV